MKRLIRKMAWIALMAALSALLGSGCQPKSWQVFTSLPGRFAVLLPGQPEEQTRFLNTALGRVEVHRVDAGQGGLLYAVSYADYPGADPDSQEAGQILEAASQAAVESIQGQVMSASALTLEGFPAREVKAQAADGKRILRARLVLAGKRLYQVMVIAPAGQAYDEEIGRFFQSFKLLGW